MTLKILSTHAFDTGIARIKGTKLTVQTIWKNSFHQGAITIFQALRQEMVA